MPEEYDVVGRVKTPKHMPALCVESPELAKKFKVTKVLVVGVPTHIEEFEDGTKAAYFTKNEIILHDGKFREINKMEFLKTYSDFLSRMDRDENGNEVKFGFGVGVPLDEARNSIKKLCNLEKAPDLVIMEGDYYKSEGEKGVIKEPTFFVIYL